MRHTLKTRRYETRNRHFPPKQFSYLRVLRAVMFEINEEPPRSDCHVQNHAADARERHHSPRMAQYGRLGRNHRGAWAPMHLPEALFAQTAEELSLEDLIEFGDSLVCRDPARRRTTLAELRKFIHSCDSFRGKNNASGHSPRFAKTPIPRPRPTCACRSNGMDSPSQSSTSRSRRRAMPRTVPQFRTACDRPNLASLSLGSCAATAQCAVA